MEEKYDKDFLEEVYQFSEFDPAVIINAIVKEINRIFPDEFSGSDEVYDWLLEHYGVTEDDDSTYITVCDYVFEDEDDLDEDQQEIIDEIIDFLEDEEELCAFLYQLLKKYQSNSLVCPILG